ncbi:MAG: type I DNA topoisomerase [Planctomycetes bacterium]|nr:type I DNA topoisomerase [Planctomycetota bacterium]
MADKLVIVESNAKARTISRYLGGDYEVMASQGHVRDLPQDKFGVDVEGGFKPTYQVLPRSRRIVGALRKAAAKAREVYLAPDPDREGEAIAWHLQYVLGAPEEQVKRVTFNEITRGAVREAFQHPRAVNHDLVDAQQARRILDRIVGYELSPLISRRVLRGLSAGRVQSVALRLVVERQRQIDAFEPVEYWEIAVVLARDEKAPPFKARLTKWEGKKAQIPDQEMAERLAAQLRQCAYRVSSFKERTANSKTYPPFITSTMQRMANNRLGFSASRTMRVAQQLYEGIDIGTETVGLITYMRTDSTRVAEQALAACRSFIKDTYGDAYLPKKPQTYRSPKGAQAAHEAIRPSDVTRSPDDIRQHLSRDQHRLYDLIWRSFVASQMMPARYKVRTAEIEAGPALLKATGREMIFDGRERVMAPAREADEQMLPELQEGDRLDLRSLEPSQHFTKPPAPYTEASLVQELERQGIGRPSTYAPTIVTLLKRNYVRRRRRALHPSELGTVVSDLLVKHFPREMDVSFTSRMEEELDEIEEGRRDWRSILEEFYGGFHQCMDRAEKEMKLERETDVVCEKCGQPMLVRFSRKGDKFLGCAGFPECKNTINLGEEDGTEQTEFRCDKCGAPMLKRIGRRGRPYLACSAYPKCRNIVGLDSDGKPVKLKARTSTGYSCPRCGHKMHLEDESEARELVCAQCHNRIELSSIQDALEKTEIAKDSLPSCEKCGAQMELRRSKKGLFLGCSNYPDCKATAPLPKERLPGPVPTVETCEECGRPFLMRWGKFGRFLACSGFPRCRNTWKLPSKPKACPREGCSGSLIRKVSQEKEPYRGCTRYPECDYREAIEKAD